MNEIAVASFCLGNNALQEYTIKETLKNLLQYFENLKEFLSLSKLS